MTDIVPILMGDQQPLMRVVGKRRDRQGLPPSPEAITAHSFSCIPEDAVLPVKPSTEYAPLDRRAFPIA